MLRKLALDLQPYGVEISCSLYLANSLIMSEPPGQEELNYVISRYWPGSAFPKHGLENGGEMLG